MKKIEAYIKHEKLDTVLDALEALGINGLSVSEVKGAGKQRGYTETYRGAKKNIRLLPKIKIEAVVPEQDVAMIVNSIIENARNGDIGDGKIFVLPVEQAFRVRTGETGEIVIGGD